MRIEEAIENLKWLLECSYVDSFEDAENKALEMAIKALEQVQKWNDNRGISIDEFEEAMDILQGREEKKMVLDQSNFIIDLRDYFCEAVSKIFGDTRTFLDFLEKGKYSNKYDCYIDYDEENYIINRETGEYINWYKFTHLGRSITISTSRDYTLISGWLENFLFEFKESEVK